MATLNGNTYVNANFPNGGWRDLFPDPIFGDMLAEIEIRIAAVGSALAATSSSSVAVGTGSKTWTIGTGKGFTAGLWLVVYRTADPTTYLIGQVTDYSGGDVTISVASGDTAGSGIYADWTLGIGGQRGPAGADGDVTAGQAWGYILSMF